MGLTTEIRVYIHAGGARKLAIWMRRIRIRKSNTKARSFSVNVWVKTCGKILQAENLPKYLF